MKSRITLSARQRRKTEEIANSLTHGVGLVFGAVGCVLLIVGAALRGGWLPVTANAVFGVSLLILYGASTWYHGSARPRMKRWLRRLDHGAIYILIAGSYTPFLVITLGNFLGWGLLVVIWGLAIAGMTVKLSGVALPEAGSVISYLFMGWLALMALQPLRERLSVAGFVLLVAGGVAYTAGVYFYARSHRRFHHAVWHLFVLAGSACHFFAVLLYVR